MSESRVTNLGKKEGKVGDLRDPANFGPRAVCRCPSTNIE